VILYAGWYECKSHVTPETKPMHKSFEINNICNNVFWQFYDHETKWPHHPEDFMHRAIGRGRTAVCYYNFIKSKMG